MEIYKYKPLGVSATDIGKFRRKRLFSFVIYSYATEIVALPRFRELYYDFILFYCSLSDN